MQFYFNICFIGWGVPWIAKKYFDETFTQGRHYTSDGRSRSDESKTYGGLLKGKNIC